MLRFAVLSLIVALATAGLTFTGLLGSAYEVGRVAFIIALACFVVAAAVAAIRHCPPV